MQANDLDDISKQLFTMELGAPTTSPLASATSRRLQNRCAHLTAAPCLRKEKENTPPRKESKSISSSIDLAGSTIESKPAANNDDDLLAREIRKWKLKNHPTSNPSKPDDQVSAQASSGQPTTPPATDKWTNIMTGVPRLKTPALPPSPPTPSRLQFRDAITTLMPQLAFETPDTKVFGPDEPGHPPRRPSLKIRRRPIGRPSPLHKKVRYDE